MKSTTDYLNIIERVSSVDDLCISTFHFLKNNNADVNLLLHKIDPDPLQVIESENKNIDFWYKNLKQIKIETGINTEISDDLFSYFFSSLNFTEDDVYIFISNKQNALSKKILPLWQSFIRVIQKSNNTLLQDLKIEYGNYVSQLLHDVSSLIELNESGKQELLDRIAYQKKINKNLLFFVRDLDLFKTAISIKDLIKDSLVLMDLNLEDLNITFKDPEFQVNSDVELISNAFNEIVKNALQHVDNNSSMISINVYNQKSKSPFLNHPWLVLEIMDEGSGIPDDFLPYIKKPFFTTNKQQGFSGFGLSNAEKIVKAHFGKIEINSKEGTTVKIFIPELPNE